jgi:repressor LexA
VTNKPYIDVNEFSKRLYDLRKENKMTMEELATILDERYKYKINKSLISKYEKAVHEPNFYFIDLTASIFHVSSDYMMGRSNNKYGESVTYKKIPIIGTIAAGIPIQAQEDILGWEYVEPGDKSSFCLRVKGDSMIGARIFNGDIVFVSKQEEVENGEIAAIQIDGEEATLKRFYREYGKVRLHSENPTIPDMIFVTKDAKEIRVLGKVSHVKFEAR